MPMAKQLPRAHVPCESWSQDSVRPFGFKPSVHLTNSPEPGPTNPPLPRGSAH